MKAGLEPRQLVEALSAGAAQSWVLANRSGRMIDDQYPLGFRLALHRKDLGIALELAEAVEVGLPVAQLTSSLEDKLLADGHGDEDMSVVAHLIRHLRSFKMGPVQATQIGVSGSTLAWPGDATTEADTDRGPV